MCGGGGQRQKSNCSAGPTTRGPELRVAFSVVLCWGKPSGLEDPCHSVPGYGLPREGSVTLHEVTLQRRASCSSQVLSFSEGDVGRTSQCAALPLGLLKELWLFLQPRGESPDDLELSETESLCVRAALAAALRMLAEGQRDQLGGCGRCPGR